jgi:hypothetical protein
LKAGFLGADQEWAQHEDDPDETGCGSGDLMHCISPGLIGDKPR